MNIQSQDYLAKLLAKENLTVQHGNYSTASFNVVDRILSLPLWADKGKAVYDLLVGHEVGHALYTPAEGWHDSESKIPGVPRSMINIIEDIRIEKLIQRTYPGIVRSFKKGYKILFDDNLFGTVGKDLTKYGFMDKLNIHSKGRGYAKVEFDDTEQMFVDLAMKVETWDDVLNACLEINDFLQNRDDYKYEDKENEDENTETGSACGEESDETGSDMGQTDEVGEDTSDAPSDSKPAENESVTDDAQRENEGDLLEKDERGKQPAYCDGIKEDTIDQMVTTYKDLAAARAKSEARTNYSIYNNEFVSANFETFISESKKVVAQMAKEFERKKAAFEYSRSQTAKKGSLDVNKLHQYQYSEDIFQTVTQLAQAKSHGIVSVLDWSGSMSGIIEDVVKQSIQIAMFCKRVNIPFEFYTFTSGANDVDIDKLPMGTIQNVDRVRITEITNNRLSKADFMGSIKALFAAAIITGDYSTRTSTGIHYGDLCTYDRMGSTPLIETTIALATLVSRFQARNAIQNTNIIILTDGQPDYLSLTQDYSDNNLSIDTYNIVLNFKGKTIKGSSTEEIYSECVKALKAYTNSTVMCFFLAGGNQDFLMGFYKIGGYVDNSIKDKAVKTFKADGLHVTSNVNGYDKFLIIKVGDKNVATEFEPKKTEKISDIKREFRKFNKNKKQVKKLVKTITDAVAA